MANGTFNFNLLSRDYPYNSATDSPKGSRSYTFHFTWETNGNQLTLGLGSAPTVSWYVCSGAGFTMRVKFRPHGGGPVQTLTEYNTNITPCPTQIEDKYNVRTIVLRCWDGIQKNFTLSAGGELWMEFGMLNLPAPTDEQPYAMPRIQESTSDQVPVEIPDPDYRPGQRKISNTWYSHNRGNGAANRKVGGTWTEMKTMDGGSGTGNPPSRKATGTWYNQRKLGTE